MRLNVSAIKTFLACPIKWHYSYVANRGQEVTRALSFGTEYHENLEHNRLIHRGQNEAERFQLTVGLRKYRQWLREWDLEFIGTEVPLEATLPPSPESSARSAEPVVLFGCLDAIVNYNGAFYHLQHKTCSQSTSVAHFTAKQHRSLHEHVYGWLARQAGYEPWGGSIIACLRKTTKRAYSKGSPLFFASIIRPNPRDEHWMDTIRNVAHRMEQYPLTQNMDSCYSWNRPCEFLEVCQGYRDLTDLPERDSLERYNGA